MEQPIFDILKSCSKDEKSFNSLYALFSSLTKKAGTCEHRLNLLERTVQHDYDAILITDFNVETSGPAIVYVNRAFTEMTGYTRDEVIGKSPGLLQGPNTDQRLFEQMKQRLGEGKSFFGTTVNYRKDGSEFVNQWDIHPLRDEYGVITNWVFYQHDVSERERLKERWMQVAAEPRTAQAEITGNIRLLFENSSLQRR